MLIMVVCSSLLVVLGVCFVDRFFIACDFCVFCVFCFFFFLVSVFGAVCFVCHMTLSFPTQD